MVTPFVAVGRGFVGVTCIVAEGGYSVVVILRGRCVPGLREEIDYIFVEFGGSTLLTVSETLARKYCSDSACVVPRLQGRGDVAGGQALEHVFVRAMTAAPFLSRDYSEDSRQTSLWVVRAEVQASLAQFSSRSTAKFEKPAWEQESSVAWAPQV